MVTNSHCATNSYCVFIFLFDKLSFIVLRGVSVLSPKGLGLGCVQLHCLRVKAGAGGGGQSLAGPAAIPEQGRVHIHCPPTTGLRQLRAKFWRKQSEFNSRISLLVSHRTHVAG